MLLLFVAACGGATGQGTSPDPGREPDIVGLISSIAATEVRTEHCVDYSSLPPDAPVSSTDPPGCTGPSPGSGSFAVRPTTSGGEIADRISVHVPGEARILRNGEEVGFDALADGQEVAIWFDGQVAESYPPQIWVDVVSIRSDP